jgi:hypothetical protein
MCMSKEGFESVLEFIKYEIYGQPQQTIVATSKVAMNEARTCDALLYGLIGISACCIIGPLMAFWYCGLCNDA